MSAADTIYEMLGSTVGAALLVLFYTIWLLQALYYTKHPKLATSRQFNGTTTDPKPNEVMESKDGNPVIVLKVDDISVRYQLPDGRKFRRSKHGFMKNYRSTNAISFNERTI